MDNVQVIFYDSKNGASICTFESTIFPVYQTGQIIIHELTVIPSPSFKKEDARFVIYTFRINEIIHGVQNHFDQAVVYTLHVSVEILKIENYEEGALPSKQRLPFPDIKPD